MVEGGFGGTLNADTDTPIRSRTHRRRLHVVAVGFAVVSTAYGARLVQLQLVDGERWRSLAAVQNAEEIEIPARRGGIYDRHGRPLALDGQEFRAFLAPDELADRDRAVETVSRILGLSGREESKLRAAEAGWAPIPRRISNSDRDRLLGALREGIHFDHLPSRDYPEGGRARALLGALDSEGGGASGIELEFDSLLAGSAGASLTRRDANGGTYWLPDAQIAEPRPGSDVILTIDAELQAIAEAALDRGLEETGASGGDIVLLDPRTGELLAVASRRGEGIRKVPAFTDPYEPGSTLKPFLLASVLAEGAAGLTDTVDAEGGRYRIGRRTIEDVHPYDTITVAEVIRYSSNIGAAKLAQLLRPSVQYRYLRDFGFGLPIGLRHPAESGGLLRRPANWTGMSSASLAMGYEISVTSLQLAAAYGALANEGVLMRPYLVREVRRSDGRSVYRKEPEALRRVVDRDVSADVVGVLATVVEEGGTGSAAALASMSVAGKTGTARLTFGGRYERRYASSFVGFTPADDPRLVVLTKLEDPQGKYYGGAVAAPIIQDLLQAALATRGIVLDRRLAVSPAEPRRWSAAEDQAETGSFIFALGTTPTRWPAVEVTATGTRPMPDLRGLPVRAAAARLLELGLNVAVAATGRVIAQDPAPGVAVARGTAVEIR